MRDWNKYLSVYYVKPVRFLSYLWGIETIHSPRRFRTLYLVFILPMRDWNSLIFSHSSRFLFKFLSYLWGIETIDDVTLEWKKMKFLSYLWGIETSLGRSCIVRRRQVFILPMRDWNNSSRVSRPVKVKSFYPTYEGLKRKFSYVIPYPIESFYPTYEGLKPLGFGCEFDFYIEVFILPMRDWNP